MSSPRAKHDIRFACTGNARAMRRGEELAMILANFMGALEWCVQVPLVIGCRRRTEVYNNKNDRKTREKRDRARENEKRTVQTM